MTSAARSANAESSTGAAKTESAARTANTINAASASIGKNASLGAAEKPLANEANQKTSARTEYSDYDYIPEPPPEDIYAPPAVRAQRVREDDGRAPRPVTTARTNAADMSPRATANASVRGDDGCEVKSADEGEFMHLSATRITGMALFGKLVTFLRRRAADPHAARARDLLSRGVQIKERADCIAFIAPDDCFLSLGDEPVMTALNAALDACGIKKRARAERTDESLMADDVERGRDLFGKDGTL